MLAKENDCISQKQNQKFQLRLKNYQYLQLGT